MTRSPDMTRPNVLMTGAAQSAPLARAFEIALAGRGMVIDGGDTLDARALMALCEARGARLVVPTRDAELPFFALHRPAFEATGVRVLAPSPESVRACQDRREFSRMLERYSYPSIPILNPATPGHDFPLFARPASGADAARARRIENADDLAALREDELLHPLIEAPEISIDLLMDLEGGRPVQAVARERVLVVGGESKVTRVIDAPEAETLAMRIGQALGLVGHNTVRAFLHPEQGPILIAINPRFGAGSGASIAAGLDSPVRILQMLAGEDAAYAPRKIRLGETLYRADRELIVPGETP